MVQCHHPEMAAPRTFRYLFPRPGEPREAAQILSHSVQPADLEAGTFVVRDEGRKVFQVFGSTEEFWSWQKATPLPARNFHEVIFGARPQRLKFDVDAPAADVAAINPEVLDRLAGGWRPAADRQPLQELAEPRSITATDKARGLVRYLLLLIMDVFDSLYVTGVAARPGQRSLVEKDFCIATSHGEKKFSYHVVVEPYLVLNHTEAQAFTARIRAEIEAEAPELAEFLDFGVNSKTQCFRLPGSQKPGSGRVKEFAAAAAAAHGTSVPPIARLLVAPPGPPSRPLLPALAPAEEGGPSPALAAGDAEKVQRLAEGALPYAGCHRFSRQVGGLLLFRRIAPSFCALCQRTHENENSLMLRVAGLPNGRAGVDELCRRAPGACRRLGEVDCAPGTFPPPGAAIRAAESARAATALEAQIEAIRAGTRDPHAQGFDHLFEQLPAARKTVYNEPQMRPYELAETLAVQAQVGVGKTRQLRAYLDAHFPAQAGGALAPAPVVRFVTFRQTFSESLRREFPDFTLYGDVPGRTLTAAAYPRLVVQVESLHRLYDDCCRDDPPAVDLLVLDEVESVLAQFSSGLHRSFNESLAVFHWLLARAGRVVCLDANLSDRTFRTLARARPRAPVHYHWNRYSRARGDRVEVTVRRGAWVSRLLGALAEGKRLVCASNSLREAKALVRLVTERFPGKRVKLYSSETPQAEKAAHFADVKRFWSEVDFLAYTPTVSAGVSYVEEHFDQMFLYLSDASCDVETARQMLGRVRALRDRAYCVCFRTAGGGRFPTDLPVIERLVAERRQHVCAPDSPCALGAPPVISSFDPAAGRIRPYRSPFYPLWLETCRIVNLSRNNFAGRFVDQVAATGAEVRWLVPPDDDTCRAGDEARKAAAEAVDRDGQEAVAGARELSPEEATRLREENRLAALGGKITRTAGEEAEVRSALAKFSLRCHYDWQSAAVTPAFVKDYHQPGVRRVFTNLQALLGAPSLGEALASIQAADQRRAAGALLAGPGEPAFTPQGGFTATARLEHAELRGRLHYPAHSYAVWLLRLCGFASVLDPVRLPLGAVQSALLGARDAITGRLPEIQFQFQVRHPPYKKLYSPAPESAASALLQVVNAVLRKMYGVEVKQAPRAGDAFLARTSVGRLFVWPGEAADGERPCLGPATCGFRPPGEAWNFVLRIWHLYCRAGDSELEINPPPSEGEGFEVPDVPPPRAPAGGAPLPWSTRPGEVAREALTQSVFDVA